MRTTTILKATPVSFGFRLSASAQQTEEYAFFITERRFR
jgi:hypothetical protein